MAEVEEGKLVRRTTIPVPVGQPTPADARKWLGQQVVYANFAGVNNILLMSNASKYATNFKIWIKKS